MFIYTHSQLELDKKSEFENIFYSSDLQESEKITSIISFYENSGAVNYLKNKVKKHFNKAESLINDLQIDNDIKIKLNQFSKTLLNREI